LLRYAQEAAWREDNRRVDTLVDGVMPLACMTALAMKKGPSVDLRILATPCEGGLKPSPVPNEQFLANVHKLQKGLAFAFIKYALGNRSNLVSAAAKFSNLFFVPQHRGAPWVSHHMRKLRRYAVQKETLGMESYHGDVTALLAVRLMIDSNSGSLEQLKTAM
jgi:hypothetical protein